VSARVAVLAPLLASLPAALPMFAAQPAFAEPVVEPTPGARGPVEALVHFGVATTPFDVTTFGEARGHAFVFLAGAGHPLSRGLSLEVRAPLVLGSVAQPAGSSNAAWATPRSRSRPPRRSARRSPATPTI
jgi:hypothetical protein